MSACFGMGLYSMSNKIISVKCWSLGFDFRGEVLRKLLAGLDFLGYLLLVEERTHIVELEV